MTLSDITRLIVRPSITAWELLPDLGDAIDFLTPGGKTVYGATVTRIEEFCSTTNFFVEYEFTDYEGRVRPMSGWVALECVL